MRKRIAECVKAHRETTEIMMPFNGLLGGRQTAGPKRRPQAPARAFHADAVLPASLRSLPPSARRPAYLLRPRPPGLGPLSITDGSPGTQPIGRLSRTCKRTLPGHFKIRLWIGLWTAGMSQFFTGAGVRLIRHYSDRLLLFLLKAWMPEKWGWRISVGNENSGRWHSPDAKTTVEECDSIDILAWSRGRECALGPAIPAVGNGCAGQNGKMSKTER